MISIMLIFCSFIIIYILKNNFKGLWLNIKSALLPLIACAMVFFIILYPKEIIDASKNGINIWVNAVLPSLLPFFIGAEILIGLGVVKFIGTLIEPIIRPLFNVPGEASFVFAMSITSGYPMGAKLTSNLRKSGVVSKVEAQRMISFCSTSGPLFMIGAVSIGMFNNQAMGPIVAISHYLGALCMGLIFRFYKNDSKTYFYKTSNENIFKKAFMEMLKARSRDGRSIGKLLGDSVRESISTLLVIGGLIVLFSVIIEELSLLGVFNKLSIDSITNYPVDNSIIKIIITGLIELTMGCRLVSEAIYLNPIAQVVLVTMIISWSGLSVHAQSASLMNDCDINISLYILSKIGHSFFSGIFAFLILIISKYKINTSDIEVFINSQELATYSWTQRFSFSILIFLGITITLLIFSLLCRKVKN